MTQNPEGQEILTRQYDWSFIKRADSVQTLLLQYVEIVTWTQNTGNKIIYR